MPKKRLYVFTNPCRDCGTDVEAKFLIPDKHAVLVANELKRKGALLCKECGLKAKDEAEDLPEAVVTMKDPADAPLAEKTAKIINHDIRNNPWYPRMGPGIMNTSPHQTDPVPPLEFLDPEPLPHQNAPQLLDQQSEAPPTDPL